MRKRERVRCAYRETTGLVRRATRLQRMARIQPRQQRSGAQQRALLVPPLHPSLPPTRPTMATTATCPASEGIPPPLPPADPPGSPQIERHHFRSTVSSPHGSPPSSPASPSASSPPLSQSNRTTSGSQSLRFLLRLVTRGGGGRRAKMAAWRRPRGRRRRLGRARTRTACDGRWTFSVVHTRSSSSSSRAAAAK